MKAVNVLAALLAVAVLFAASGCTPDPTDDKPAATVNAPQEPAAPAEGGEEAAEPAEGDDAAAEPAAEEEPAADAAVYAMQPDMGSIAFEGSKATGTHVGGFSEYEGTVTIPGDDLTQAKIDIVIDMNSTFSDDADLTDAIVGEKLLHVKEYPTATFKSTGIAKNGDQYDVSGDFTLHGVTNNITFPATIELSDGTLTAEAEFAIDRNNWDIVWDGGADTLIRDNVLITMYIYAEKAE